MINGKFRLIQSIGAGGMGQVFKAEQLPLGRLVAVKVVHPHLGQNGSQSGTSESGPEAFQRRFFREASALSQLRHRNIVTVYDYGRIEGQESFFMVLEFLDGQPLSAPLRGGGRLDEVSVVDVLRQVARGLREVHQAGLVHRDLKPANLFLATEGDEIVCKLLDFGLVKQVSGQNVEPDDLTAAGTLLGSPMYMAPEQIDGRLVDARTDIYSLGAVIYHCLAGKPPFEGSLTQVMIQHSHAEPPYIAERSPGVTVSPALEHIVRRCLAKDPAARYGSIDELLADLSTVEMSLGIPTSGPRPSIPSGRASVRPPGMASSGSWSSGSRQMPPGVGPAQTMPGVARTDLSNPSMNRPPSGVMPAVSLSGSLSGSMVGRPSQTGAWGQGSGVLGPVETMSEAGRSSIRPPSDEPSAGSLLQPGATTLSATPPVDAKRWAVGAGVAGALLVSVVVGLVLHRTSGPPAPATVNTAASAASAAPSAKADAPAADVVHLDTQPSGARVLDGDVQVGVTPFDLPLSRTDGRTPTYDLVLDGFERGTFTPARSHRNMQLTIPLRLASTAPVATGKARPQVGRPVTTGATTATGAKTGDAPAIRMTR